MNLSLIQLTAVFFTGLLLSGVFSMLEAAVISQDKHRLIHYADQGDKNAIVMRRLMTRTDRLLSALLLCNNLANVTCAATATAIVTRLLGASDAALLIVTLLVTFLLLVFSEITPKVIGVKYAQPISFASARPLRGIIWCLTPFVNVANFFSSCLLRLLGVRDSIIMHEAMNFEELRSAVRTAGRAEHTGANGDDVSRHYDMVEKTLLFSEIPIERIMTPRRNIRGIRIDADDADIAAQIRRAEYSKMPIIETNIDETKGIVDTMQALKAIRHDRLSAAALQRIAEPVHFIPAAATALQQLQILRREWRRLGLVLDGAGRVVGLVTFANFAAAILGGETPPRLRQQQDGSIVAFADTPLAELEQSFPRLLLPETTATNINGMILDYLGDLPDFPVCLTLDGWRIEILSIDDKSVRRVRLYPPNHKESEAPVD